MPILRLPLSWDLGLREDLRPGSRPLGAADIARDVTFYRSAGPRSRHGFQKILKDLPPPSALRLDGRTTALVTDRQAAGSSLNLDTTDDWTLAIRFQPNRLDVDPGVLIYEFHSGDGTPIGGLRVFIIASGGDFICRASFSDQTSTNYSVSDDTPIILGQDYEVWVTRQKTGNFEIKVDAGSWTSVASGSSDVAQVSDKPAILAGHYGYTDQLDGRSPFRSLSRLDLHRFRIWKGTHRATDDDAPTIDYHFAETSGVTVSDSKGVGPDFNLVPGGQTEIEELALQQMASGGLWETDSPLLGDASLRFNGISSMLRLPNAYRYRRPIYDSQNEEWQELGNYAILFKVRLEQVVTDSSICMMVPAERSALPADTWYFKVGINGSSKFFFAAGTGTGAFTSVATSTTTATADTDYLILVRRSEESPNNKIYIKVATSSASFDEEVSSNVAGTYLDPVAGDSDHEDIRSWKYGFVIGVPVTECRNRPAIDDQNNPDSFLLECDWSKALPMVMDGFAFIGEDQPVSGAGPLEDSEVLKLFDSPWEREQITALASKARVLSYYKMDAGAGDYLEDTGLLGNALEMATDLDVLHVPNLAGYTVSEEAPDPITGLFEHWSTRGSGTRRKIGVSSSAVWELDESAGTRTMVGRGLRKSVSGPWSGLAHGERVILAGGDIPFQFTGEEVFPLGIETLDASRVRYGLHAQGQEWALLDRGVRRYRLVYYSAYTDEEGDWSDEITVPIGKGVKATVAMGSDGGEGGSPSLPLVNQRPARHDGTEVEPYDLTGGAPGSFVAAEMKVTVAFGAVTGDLVYTVRVGREHVDNVESVTADDLARVIRGQIATCAAYGITAANANERTVRLETGYRGETSPNTAYLTIDSPDAGTGITDLSDIVWGSPSPAQVTGTDNGPSELVLPMPQASPQATHLRVYRTQKSGSVFYRALEIPLGSSPAGTEAGFYFIDNVSDEDLVFRPVMDERRGRPPKATMVAELSGNVVYAGHPDFPYRLWYSVPDRASDVPPYQFVDILAGRSLDITGIERFGGALQLFKERATIVAVPTSSEVLPLRFELRDAAHGCVGRSAVTPSEFGLLVGCSDYPSIYNSVSFDHLGRGVIESWQAIQGSDLDVIVATYDNQREQFLLSDPENAQVFCYQAGKGWSLWERVKMRAVGIMEGDRIDETYFSDEYGNVCKLGGLSDGGNYVEDEMSEVLNGTGFTISGSTATLTGFTVAEAESDYVRGLYLRLVEADGTEDSVPILYADDSNGLVLERAPGVSTDASGTWQIGPILANWRSSEIQGDGISGIVVDQIRVDLDDPSVEGWPTTHSVTLVGRPRSGVVTVADIEKSVPVNIGDFVQGFGFHCRSFHLGLRSHGPKVPFGCQGFTVEYRPAGRGRPL